MRRERLRFARDLFTELPRLHDWRDVSRGDPAGVAETVGSRNGDIEYMPEIKSLTGVHVAFMTMNLPYTMPPSEAAECVKSFQPKMVHP